MRIISRSSNNNGGGGGVLGYICILVLSFLNYLYINVIKLLEFIRSGKNNAAEEKNEQKEMEGGESLLSSPQPTQRNGDNNVIIIKPKVAVLTHHELELQMQKKALSKLCDDLTHSINTNDLEGIYENMRQIKKVLISMKRIHKIPKSLNVYFYRVIEVLYAVIEKGDSQYLDKVLTLKLFNINNYPGQHPYTLVQYTCFIGNCEILKLLISHGANCNVATSKGETPLHLCCSMGYANCVPILFAINVDPNPKTLSGSTPLHRASQGGHFECVVELLRNPRVKVNELDKYGESPLMRASAVPHVNCMEILFLHGAVFTPVMLEFPSVTSTIIHVVQRLLKISDKSITAQTTINQMKPFFETCGGEILKKIQEDSQVFGNEINVKISSYAIDLSVDKDITIQNSGKSNLDITIRLPYSPTYKIHISPDKFQLRKVHIC